MRKALKSVQIMFMVAPLATVIKIVQQAVAAAMAPLSLFFIQRLIDVIVAHLNGSTDISAVVLWIVLLVIAALLSDNINYVGALQVITMQRKLNEKLTAVFMDKLRNIEYSCFENSANHDILQRMGSEPQRRIFNVFQGVTDIFAALIAAVGLCLMVAQVSFIFALLLFFVLLLMMWFEFKGISMQVTLWNNQAKEDRQMTYLTDLLSDKRSLLELKSFGAVDYICEKWNVTAERTLDKRIKTAIRAQKYHGLSNLSVILWMASITVLLIQSLFAGTITLGLFVSLIGSVKSVSGVKIDLERAFSNITRFQLEMENYEKFMDLPETDVAKEDSTCPIPDANRSLPGRPTHNRGFLITFDNVVFKYPGAKKPVLDGVTFEMDSREHVALVGRNGSGKSTIVKLLGRLYTPESGRITINGIAIEQYAKEQLRACFSFIYQDFCCYQLSLRENVALGSIEKIQHDDVLARALSKALFDEPGVGLDSNLGKLEADGVDLSGGQWQRLALARALVSESGFVVLDEPTASLDPLAECRMYQSFSEVMEDRGCLMISHRLASAKMCEKIIVLDNGFVTEMGNHRQLLKRGGLYYKMFSLQSAWYTSGDHSASSVSGSDGMGILRGSTT